ncbi:hypothetical protein EHQ12_01005 [Leptospira gomenensis]|uniref:Uncharacterized protein n=1 Tax=Leptospira gomenensis TaxID=2484974 RepID=A0A5F1Z3B6_9LEPT|nr:hypothetical protein [Leptospira gomenensis]TGK29038.1 hypothetical protein EHQ17_16930 [Leptospira gomenensis]TGK45005.1 hypothetical protein EHQ12_01005 [Leptospira gomenensis]TGK51859.1 hypothetical protein EHQ07_01600 [Leptospira gomenensis]TGK67333.1 hypothetical protein EHQ13_02470 [Leptospira gomenensis]
MNDLRSEFSEKQKIELEKRLELKNLFIDKIFLGLILTVLGGLGEVYLEKIREADAANQKWLEYHYELIKTNKNQYYDLDAELQGILNLNRRSNPGERKIKLSEYKKKIDSFTISVNQNPLTGREEEKTIQAILILHNRYYLDLAMEYVDYCNDENVDPDLQGRCTALRLLPGVLADNFKAAIKKSVKIKEDRDGSEFKIRGIDYLIFADQEKISDYVETTVSDFADYLKKRKQI